MTSNKLIRRVRFFVSHIRIKKSLLLMLSAIVFVLLFYWNIYSLLFRSYADIPKLPDFKNQSKTLVNYIKKFNENALNNSSSDKVIGELAMVYHANFFYTKAKICYSQAIALNPNEWKWTYYLALINEELGDNKTAISNLKDVIKINPNISQVWFKLGNTYLKTNSYKNASVGFNKVLKLGTFLPSSDEFLHLNRGAFPLAAYAALELSRTEFLEGKLQTAKAILESLVESNPTFGAAYRLLGKVYLKLNKKDESIKFETRAGDFENYLPPADPIYDKLILFSRNTGFIINQIEIASKSENYEWAFYLIKHVLSYDPNNGEAITRELKLYLDTQHFDKAKQLLHSYFEIYNSNEIKLIDMAKYLAFRAQFEQAVKLLKRVIKLNPNSVEAHIEFINILSEFKQYDTAIEYCNEVIKTQPNNIEIRNELTEMLIYDGQIEKAKQQIKILQKLQPNNEINFVLLARISKMKNMIKNAVFYYEKSIEANPNNINIRLEIGQYLLGLRKYQEAINHYKSSLKIFPNNINLIERYAWILAGCPNSKVRNEEKALKLAKRLTLMRKFTQEQEIRCGTTLAAAYSANKQFSHSREVAANFIKYAEKTKENKYFLILQKISKLAKLNKQYFF